MPEKFKAALLQYVSERLPDFIEAVAVEAVKLSGLPVKPAAVAAVITGTIMSVLNPRGQQPGG